MECNWMTEKELYCKAFNGVRNFIAALALLPVLLFMQRKAPKKTQTLLPMISDVR